MFDKYDHLLFDLDNTLLDFSKTSMLAFQEMIQFYELNESIDYYSIYSPINAKFWHYFEKQKVTANELKIGRYKEFIQTAKLDLKAEDLANKYLELLIKHSFWIDGAKDLLQKLAKTHQLSIITNGLSEAQHKRLEKHSMKQYFKEIFISEEIGISKPHAGFFEEVESKINFPDKDKVLIIGDNPKSDIKGGCEYGYDTCWFNYRKDKKQSVKSTYKVNCWKEFNLL